jgi:3-deoxy-D-arabino-heptulosonate 7-phosphate (DAHP) synthase
MKKLLVLAALACAVVVGTVTVMTVHPRPAVADCAGSQC